MLSLRHEPMADFFDKFHVGGLPRAAVFHRFTNADLGDPHDHPWPFTSFIVSGGYIEEVFDRRNGAVEVDVHRPGDSFRVEAHHVHRIVQLLDDECWTLILPEAYVHEPGFWQFRDDGPWRRPWNGDWAKR